MIETKKGGAPVQTEPIIDWTSLVGPSAALTRGAFLLLRGSEGAGLPLQNPFKLVAPQPASRVNRACARQPRLPLTQYAARNCLFHRAWPRRAKRGAGPNGNAAAVLLQRRAGELGFGFLGAGHQAGDIQHARRKAPLIIIPAKDPDLLVANQSDFRRCKHQGFWPRPQI